MGDDEVLERLRRFVAARDWAQFHSPAALARSVAIEAGELLERFQWSDEADPQGVTEELADVLTYCYLLADRLGVSPHEIVLAKLETTGTKYPVDKAHGVATRYDEL